MYETGMIEMEAVLAVARLGGFRAAARALGMSSTALSRAVAQLETRLGVRLFNRTTRSVALTEAGDRFVAAVGPALAEIQQAMASANDGRATPSGTLRLNCAEGAALAILAPVVLEYLRRFPDMQVDIVTEANLVDIVGKGFDAGIRSLDRVPRDMIAVPFGAPLRFCVVAAPAWFATRPVPRHPDDLLAHQCIRTRWPSGAIDSWQFARGGETLSVDVPGVLTLDSSPLMREAALAGAGIAYVWEAAVADDVAQGRLVEVLGDWSVSTPGLCLYYPDRRHVTAAMRALIALLRERLPAAPPGGAR